jgi:hypothetical protein
MGASSTLATTDSVYNWVWFPATTSSKDTVKKDDFHYFRLSLVPSGFDSSVLFSTVPSDMFVIVVALVRGAVEVSCRISQPFSIRKQANSGGCCHF